MNRGRLTKLKQTLTAIPCPRCRQRAAPERPWTPSACAAWDALTDAERAEVSALMDRVTSRCTACERVTFELSKSNDEDKRRALALLRRVLGTPFSDPALG